MTGDIPAPDPSATRPRVDGVRALTFDLFGTVLDLGGSLTPYIARFLQGRNSPLDAPALWEQWRYRQRIEQYQDTLVMLGHSGYLETARRAFAYVLAANGISASDDEVSEVMEAWKRLEPFEDARLALPRLSRRYRLVALSNGDAWFLEHLVKERICYRFEKVISVDVVGAFKPHPAVYRAAARILGLEPHEIMMVSSNSFDVMGARMSGNRAAWVNRYGLPFEDRPYRPTLTVGDFTQLAEAIA